jgi:uncharacterized protein
MLFSRKKQDDEVGKQIVAYCELIGQTVGEYRRMIADYIDWDKEFKKRTKRVHKLEAECDELRRSIQRGMFQGAFLPAYREDYVALLEKLDRVANKAEDAGDTLYLIRPDIPDPIRPTFVEIADLSVQAYEPVPAAVAGLLEGETDVDALARHVQAKEREVDKLQFNLIRQLFRDLDLGKGDAMCLKMLVDQICEVSDKIENVTDQMAIVAIKRHM